MENGEVEIVRVIAGDEECGDGECFWQPVEATAMTDKESLPEPKNGLMGQTASKRESSARGQANWQKSGCRNQRRGHNTTKISKRVTGNDR